MFRGILGRISPDVIGLALFILGMGLFGVWLFRSRLGTRALIKSPVRRNNMEFYAPFAFLLAWLMLAGLVESAIKPLEDVGILYETTFRYVFLGAVNLVIIAVALIYAHRRFVRGLRGFGLGLGKIWRDLGFSFVNLLGVIPLVIGGAVAIMIAGKAIMGSDFKMPSHRELLILSGGFPIWFRVLAFVFICVITPVIEEVLFRGLFQSVVRSYLVSPWRSIFVSSLIFTVLHQPLHWVPLLALSIGLGYSYEKSGSLLRPILMHAMFNSFNVIATFYQPL